MVLWPYYSLDFWICDPQLLILTSQASMIHNHRCLKWKKAWGNPPFNLLRLAESGIFQTPSRIHREHVKVQSNPLTCVSISLSLKDTKSILTRLGFTLSSASFLVSTRILSEKCIYFCSAFCFTIFFVCSQLSSLSNYPQKKSRAISIYYIWSIQKLNPHNFK